MLSEETVNRRMDEQRTVTDPNCNKTIIEKNISTHFQTYISRPDKYAHKTTVNTGKKNLQNGNETKGSYINRKRDRPSKTGISVNVNKTTSNNYKLKMNLIRRNKSWSANNCLTAE